MTSTVGDTWLVAVDDDPTGCQSVSGVPLLTAWDDDTLHEAARRNAPVTFVLTNSRSMPEDEAVRVNSDVGAALRRVAHAEGLRLRLISRSDSTLRGHFPAEVDALTRGADIAPDAVVICPAFFEAGRYTADGIQWVQRNGELTPACRTEFARDATFGFDELTLADWARNRGATDAVDIGLAELTEGDEEAIASKLPRSAGRRAIVVNATNYDHLRVFDTAARRAEADGATFIYRTGPSFVRAAAGLDAPAIADLRSARDCPGLIVVGSHTDITNAQIDHAATSHTLEIVELDATLVIDTSTATDHIDEVVGRVVAALEHRSVVVRTSRAVITGDPTRTPLEISRTVAAALTHTIRIVAATAPPGWVIAKGGITSHELLTAFGVRTAEVTGQALPGIIPVLEIAIADKHVPYIIFPGNVGDAHTLTRVLDQFLLHSSSDPSPTSA